MAENGNLSNNNYSTTPRTTTLQIQGGLTEFDATHPRLRNDLEPVAIIVCQSCHLKFEAASLRQIYEHYRELDHYSYYRNCLYCQGKVHQYFHSRHPGVQIYHNCLRWKRGEDK